MENKVRGELTAIQQQWTLKAEIYKQTRKKANNLILGNSIVNLRDSDGQKICKKNYSFMVGITYAQVQKL